MYCIIIFTNHITFSNPVKSCRYWLMYDSSAAYTDVIYICFIYLNPSKYHRRLTLCDVLFKLRMMYVLY